MLDLLLKLLWLAWFLFPLIFFFLFGLFWACVLCKMPFSKDQWSLANCKRGINKLIGSSVCIGGICWLTGINLKWLGQVMWLVWEPSNMSPDWTPLISCLEDLRLVESILRVQRDKKTDYLICRLFYKKGVMWSFFITLSAAMTGT